MFLRSVTCFVALVLLTASNWKVEKLKGEAEFYRKNSRSPISKGSVLLPGDKVVTKKASKLKIVKGDSQLFLGQNTSFIIPQDKKNDSQNSFLNLLRGKIRAKVKKGSVKNFEVSTPTAVAGVRGTEFFVQADENKGFVCTIDGSVEVKRKKSQEKIDVPMCSGVSLSPDTDLQLRPTPSALVSRWVAETSVEENNPNVNDQYDFQISPVHQWKDKIFYSNKLFLNVISLNKADYGSSGSNAQDNTISYLRYSPSIVYKSNFRFQLQGRYYLGSSSENFSFVKSGDSKKEINVFRLGETFFEKQFGLTDMKLGLQSVKWNDGNLLSRDFWGVDGYLYPGLRLTAPINKDYYYDFIAFGKGDESDLSGQVPVELVGLKIDYRAWMNFYFLSRDYKPEESFSSLSLFDNHKVFDMGMESGHKLVRWDYRVFYNYQTNESFRKSTDKNLTASSVGFDYGYYPYPTKNMRFGLSFKRASENYLPGFESPYLMGYSQIIRRSNVQQFRFKFSYSWNDRWTMLVEQIKNANLNQGVFSEYSEPEKDLLDELDIGFLYNNPDSNLNALIAIYSVKPQYALKKAKSWTGSDDGFGLVLNIQKSF